MKKLEKILSLFMSMVMFFSITASIDFSSLAGCLTCSYNSAKQELTIIKSTDGEVTFIPGQYSNIKSLVIGEGIERVYIDDYKEIEKLSLPASLYEITSLNTFGADNKLKTITVNKENKRYFTYDGVLYFKDDTPDGYYYTLLIYPKGKKDSNLKVYSQTDRLTDSAFAYTKYLKSVDMSGVKKAIHIDEYAFFGSSVETIKMPKKIAYIGEQTFALSKLKSISLESSVKTEFDGQGIFRNCNNLTKIVLGDKTSFLPENFALNCPKLKSIYIPLSVKSIDLSALGSYIPADSQENIIYYYKDFTLYSKNNHTAIDYAINTKTKHKKALAPPKLSLKFLKAGKNCFTANWAMNAKATGYQIQYSTSSKFKSAKLITIGQNKSISKKITNLKAKTKYYVRIRTYKTYAGKKIYFGWSNTKVVKTK